MVFTFAIDRLKSDISRSITFPSYTRDRSFKRLHFCDRWVWTFKKIKILFVEYRVFCQKCNFPNLTPQKHRFPETTIFPPIPAIDHLGSSRLRSIAKMKTFFSDGPSYHLVRRIGLNTTIF